jgi:dihydrofolate reductase
MRKVIVSMAVSLDGVMEEPAWMRPYLDKALNGYKCNELSQGGALLLGRKTYQGFKAFYPEKAAEEDYAEKMNRIPKYVFSRTLDKVEWSNTVLVKILATEQVGLLKQKPGNDLLVYGSGELVETLREYDLIDEYRLLIFPVVLGGGKRLFRNGWRANLRLIDSQNFDCGSIALTYRPGRST